MTAAAARSAGATFTYVFRPGPVGLALQDSSEGVLVGSVEPQSQAARAGVPLLSVLLEVDGTAVSGLSRSALMGCLANRGEQLLTLRLRHPPDAPTPQPQPPPERPQRSQQRSQLRQQQQQQQQRQQQVRVDSPAGLQRANTFCGGVPRGRALGR